jgi:hypothetical protein
MLEPLTTSMIDMLRMTLDVELLTTIEGFKHDMKPEAAQSIRRNP